MHLEILFIIFILLIILFWYYQLYNSNKKNKIINKIEEQFIDNYIENIPPSSYAVYRKFNTGNKVNINYLKPSQNYEELQL